MARFLLNLITDAVDEPVTLAQAKDHLRIDGTTEDAYIQSLIYAARKAIEGEINRPIGEQTFELGISKWPDLKIELPRLPFQSLISIKYTVEAGTVTTLHDTESSPAVESEIFHTDEGDDYTPGTLYLKSGESWPSDTLAPGYPIRIRFTAGITDLSEDLYHAHLLTLAHLFEHRETVTEGQPMTEVPMSAKWLCQPHRYYIF